MLGECDYGLVRSMYQDVVCGGVAKVRHHLPCVSVHCLCCVSSAGRHLAEP